MGSLGHPELDRIVARDTLAELEAGRSGVRHYGPEGQTTPEDLENAPTISVFVESWAPPPQMWIFGAVDFTAALSRVAKVLGYRVIVCDAREIFATRRRFPAADEVVVSWPGPLFDQRGSQLGSRDAVCILTHDPKFDVPAVQGAVATRVGYIGVMGSRRTHDTAHRPAPRGGGHRRRAGATDVADRPRPRCAHARGDGDLDLRRDHRPPHRQGGPVPEGRRRPDPRLRYTTVGPVRSPRGVRRPPQPLPARHRDLARRSHPDSSRPRPTQPPPTRIALARPTGLIRFESPTPDTAAPDWPRRRGRPTIRLGASGDRHGRPVPALRVRAPTAASVSRWGRRSAPCGAPRCGRPRPCGRCRASARWPGRHPATS